MFIKRDLIIVLVALIAAALFAGCSAAMKDSGGDQTGAGGGLVETAQFVGLDNCYLCHGQTRFRQWVASKHGNFQLEDGTEVMVDYAFVSLGLHRVYNDLARELGADLHEKDLPDHLRHAQAEMYQRLVRGREARHGIHLPHLRGAARVGALRRQGLGGD